MPTKLPTNSGNVKSFPDNRWFLTPVIKISIVVHVVGLVFLVVNLLHWTWILASFFMYHLVLGLVGLVPKSRLLGSNIIRLPEGEVHRHEVALTFDDGPDPLTTPMVLDILDRYGARASFFCIGERVAAYPAIVSDIVKRGHSVENHSYRHSYFFAFYGLKRQCREIERTQKAAVNAVGRLPHFFRAPVGFRNVLLYPVLKRLGLEYVSWTTRGFDAVSSDAEKVLMRLTKRLAGGDILLLHDAGSAKTASDEPVVLNVLPDLLDILAKRGLRAISLPMAFESGLRQPPS
jgi:peptidoglycan/xylan/chitin deacetylase (PgdA/CDA1 family)